MRQMPRAGLRYAPFGPRPITIAPGDALIPDPLASTLVLEHATSWIELRMLSGRWAEVVRGNLWAKGDWVECPPWVDWAEAGELTLEGHTVLPPTLVRLVYDALGDAFLFSDEAGSP